MAPCCTDPQRRNAAASCRPRAGWPALRRLALLRAALAALALHCGGSSAAEQPAAELPCREPLCYTASRLEAERNRLLLYDIDIVDTTRGISHIKADVAEATGEDIASSAWVLTGHVRVFIPEGELHADRATVQFANKRIDTMTAEGAPAEFQHTLENGQTAHGHARSITFDMQRNEVHLNGDGWLSDGCHEITSGHIGYNITSQRVWADIAPGDTGRVHGTIKAGTSSSGSNPCATGTAP